MSEIETSAWDGRPQNPEQSGWHWLSLDGLAPEPWLWCPHPQWFWLSNRSMRPADNPRGWSYLGPCITPAERDALAARVAKAEQMAEAPADLETALQVLASLVAAVSLLKRAEENRTRPSRAAASDKMFAQMIADYEKATEQGRTALAAWRAAAKDTPDAR